MESETPQLRQDTPGESVSLFVSDYQGRKLDRRPNQGSAYRTSSTTYRSETLLPSTTKA